MSLSDACVVLTIPVLKLGLRPPLWVKSRVEVPKKLDSGGSTPSPEKLGKLKKVLKLDFLHRIALYSLEKLNITTRREQAMVNLLAKRCATPIKITATKVGLWGYNNPDNLFEKYGKDVLNDACFDDTATSSQESYGYYVYKPGDGCDVIEDQDGINLLWLRQIEPSEISLNHTRNGKVQVSYNNQPIIRMRGVELIRTENGCYSLDYWLNAA